jgi:hypothetical protein
MYKLTQNFAGISFMTGMAVSANRDKYKTYQFNEKPSKEEIKKIILDDMKLIDNQLPKPTSYLLSKNNETLYKFDVSGCMIENYKFEELIKKIYSETFLLDLKGIEEFEEDYLEIKDYLSSYIYGDELIILSYYYAPKRSANRKKIIKKLKSLNIENEKLVEAIFKFIMDKRHKNV